MTLYHWKLRLTQRVLPLLVVWSILPATLLAQSSSDTTGLSSHQRQVLISVDTTRTLYSLSDSLIIPNSEQVWADSLLLQPNRDYLLDHVNGMLRLIAVFPSETGVRVRYRRFPFELRRAYFHRRLQLAGNGASSGNGQSVPISKPVQRQASERPAFGSRLRNSGSIQRAISVGSNQNLRVDSGLRMQISGNLTDDVEVIASLTDQNTPIQPEGNTQTLQEIDKVFIQIKSPHAQATFGDYNLNLAGTQFTNYSRKLQGAMATAQFGNTKVTASGAVSRGRFASNEFLGQEGNQGPYQLRGPEGQINIIVLAGTERVWVDGELMTRGEDHDYVIEYGNGQITFSRNRLITADSRITVDFQFSDESYQRNLWSGRAESQFLGEKVRLQTTFIRETDDKDQPLGLALNDDFVAALEAAGDSLAVVPGSSFVGEGNGAYVRDSTGVFAYVGPSRGDHDVKFSFVGENNGEYRNIGLGRFEYVGENRGSYRPVIVLPQAQRHDVVGFNLDANPHEAFEMQGEFAMSQLDRNLFSALDDDDNQGMAYSLNLQFRPQRLAIGNLNLGRFELSSRLRRKNDGFQDIDRTTQVEFNRRWDISGAQTSGERIEEVSGLYAPLSGLSFRGGAGRLAKGDLFESQRWDFATTLNTKRLPRLQYHIESIEREDKRIREKSDWLRQRGQLEMAWRAFTPILQYEGEIRAQAREDSAQTGFRFDSFTAGMRLNPWKNMRAAITYNLRDDQERVGQRFQPESGARTLSLSWTLMNWHAISANAAYTHRERDYVDPATQDTRTDLADFRLGFSPKQNSVRGNWYYQVSNTQVARQEEVFIEVGDGEGNFRFNEERNEFEPDPFGNFIRQLLATNDFIPVVELKMRTDLRIRPGRFFDANSGQPNIWQRLLSPISTETFLRVDERSTERNVSKIYLLHFDHFQDDSTTIFGSLDFRQDVYLWQNSRQFSIRYRFRSRSELNNQFIGGGQDRTVLEHRLRILKKLSNLVTGQAEFIRSREDRLFRSPGREDREVRSNRVDLDLTYRPQSRLEIGLKSSLSFNRDVALQPATEARLLAFAPRSTYSLSQKGRLHGEINWTKVVTTPNNRLIPFELTNGSRTGTTWRWNLGFDYRISNHIQASLNYIGRNEPDRPKTQHLAMVEMRAFF